MIISGLSAPPIHSSRNFVFSGGPCKPLGLQLSMFHEQMRTLMWLCDEYSASRSSRRVSTQTREMTLLAVVKNLRGVALPIQSALRSPSHACNLSLAQVQTANLPVCPSHQRQSKVRTRRRTSSTESLSTNIC